jgi:hypothetical protein
MDGGNQMSFTHQIRALLYRYSYVPLQEHEKTGLIWQRQFLGSYWPVHALEKKYL